MKTYNHMFTVAFTVKSPNDGGSVTESEILAGIQSRLDDLRLSGEAIEAVGLPDDTFIEEDLPTQPWDGGRALGEGWDLFEVDGRLQLQRIDCPSDHGDLLPYSEPKFSSDAQALIEVAARARQGSAYHLEALELIGTLALKENDRESVGYSNSRPRG
jgi:hypothetical protein